MPAASRSSSFAEYLAATRTEPVYVILGVQGSGTNLLRRILERTFGFSVLRDRSRVFEIAAALGSNPSHLSATRAIEQFRAVVNPSARQKRAGMKYIQKNEPFDGIFDELTASAIGSSSDFARLVYAYRAFATGATAMAVKSDDLWEHIQHLDTVIPDRRIILLTRDFRDNLVSIGGKHFGPIEPICAARYVKRQFLVYDAEYQRAGDRGYHVKFETLVERPMDFVADFSRRFGVSPLPQGEEVLESMVMRPNKVAKWKRLPARELGWCEAILRDQLHAYGYALDQPAARLPSAAVVAAATARDAVKRIPQKLRQLAVHLRA